MFVGRTGELAVMNKLYAEGTFQMVVVHGRRRSGKTTLISEFSKDKPTIFFTVPEANSLLNLRRFSEEVCGFFGMSESAGEFGSWREAFLFIAGKAKEQRFVLVMDEFPKLDSSIQPVLQNAIDYELKNTGLYLVLCGSEIGFIEREVLGASSPLFGRRTSQLKIEAFDYFDAAKMLPGISSEDKIKYYACIGGMPHYLSQINPARSFEENLTALYFEPQGGLYGEPATLLRQELREPAVYNSVLSAIAAGSNRLNDISAKIGEPASKTGKYIKTLLDLRVLRREILFGEDFENSRKTRYQIADNCFCFWYKFVFDQSSEIETGAGRAVAEKAVFPFLSEFIEKAAFEEICRQYIVRKNKESAMPFLLLKFGTWWGTDSRVKRESIGIVADNKPRGRVLLGECRWQNRQTDANEIQELLQKTCLLPGYNEYHCMFFSKASYTDDTLKLKREHENLHLVSLEMLFE